MKEMVKPHYTVYGSYFVSGMPIKFSNYIPIMLALYLMLLLTNYALNYASIIATESAKTGHNRIFVEFQFIKYL